MINRDDMLELTRRMTPSTTCFDRITGAYIDEMGEIEDSFNIHFGKSAIVFWASKLYNKANEYNGGIST